MTSVAEHATGGGADVVVTPLLHQGYRPALLVGAALVALAVAAAGALRHRFPHHLGPLPRRVHAARRAAAEG
ncbi:hypothetical protein [Nonomuraea helvata]|uniref:Uncharacterized protein n=1 Tax=Nonomuraea helvata TaxID=37484 RepID=A0ABV5SD13_9ACTN